MRRTRDDALALADERAHGAITPVSAATEFVEADALGRRLA